MLLEIDINGMFEYHLTGKILKNMGGLFSVWGCQSDIIMYIMTLGVPSKHQCNTNNLVSLD